MSTQSPDFGQSAIAQLHRAGLKLSSRGHLSAAREAFTRVGERLGDEDAQLVEAQPLFEIGVLRDMGMLAGREAVRLVALDPRMRKLSAVYDKFDEAEGCFAAASEGMGLAREFNPLIAQNDMDNDLAATMTCRGRVLVARYL